MARLRPLQVFEFDPTGHIRSLMIQPYNISVLPILEFKSRIGFWEDIPPKQRTALNADGHHVHLVHATSPAGLRGILTEAKLDPLNYIKRTRVHFLLLGIGNPMTFNKIDGKQPEYPIQAGKRARTLLEFWFCV